MPASTRRSPPVPRSTGWPTGCCRATAYEGTDLTVATSFNTVDQDLKHYLPITNGYVPDVSTRRGDSGTIAPPRDPHQRDGERPSV